MLDEVSCRAWALGRPREVFHPANIPFGATVLEQSDVEKLPRLLNPSAARGSKS